MLISNPDADDKLIGKALETAQANFVYDMPEGIDSTPKTNYKAPVYKTDDNGEEDKPLKPIPEKILSSPAACNSFNTFIYAALSKLL